MFVITSMPVGGAETLLVNLLRNMNKEQFCPEVICLKQPGPLGQELAAELPVHSGVLRFKYDTRVLPRLTRLLQSRQADAVVTVGSGDKMFWGRIAAYLAGVPVIASALHSTGWPDGVGRLNRSLNRITDAFIAVAHQHGRFLAESHAFPSEKIHVIRNGIDCDRFRSCPSARRQVRRELGLAEDTPLVGIVAALRAEKNHLMLARAAARVRQLNPQAHWVIVGDGPERHGIEELAKDLHINDRIHFLGTRHDTDKLIAALDAFTLCSLNEASPVSILEAMACEIPVVATDVGSVSESLTHGKTGLLIPSKDVKAMAIAVAELLSNPEQRTSMGKAARAAVLNQGSLEAMVDGYQSLIGQIYDQKARTAVAEVRPSRQPLVTSQAGSESLTHGS